MVTDPTRWRDNLSGLSADTKSFLRGVRSPLAPTPHDIAALGADVDAIERTTAPSPAPWRRRSVAAAAGFAIIGGATLGWALHIRGMKAEPAAERVGRARVEGVAARASRDLDVPIVASQTPIPVEPVPRPGHRRLAQAHVASSLRPPAGATDTLASEVPLIDEARRGLLASPSRALAVLEAHRRGFPHGQLATEREFLAVQALLQMKRTADAKQRAAELAARYPASAYAARASRLIEAEPGSALPGRP